ncbi:hypothetical protein B0H17DRAFT_1200399 [Mycena rosella]|uniref:Uncharacterized protein n=1 Tax=Mycena rosella TaxID=1033263 RepID=A0AAD7GKU8_MYCRO|nr:hypothetical protein B0H17DRAFT_1200399 [Mycena rosella]
MHFAAFRRRSPRSAADRRVTTASRRVTAASELLSVAKNTVYTQSLKPISSPPTTGNNTQDFMDAVLSFDDHRYIMRIAREEDASGLERKRKTALAELRVKLADMRKQKEMAKREKALADLRRLLQVWNLTIPKLHDQLDVFRLRGVPDIKANGNYSKKTDKQAALVEALRKFQQSPESFPVPESVLARLLEPETAVVEYLADEEDIEMAD